VQFSDPGGPNEVKVGSDHLLVLALLEAGRVEVQLGRGILVIDVKPERFTAELATAEIGAQPEIARFEGRPVEKNAAFG